MKTVSFTGTASGDGECFCWDKVNKEDKIAILGAEIYKMDEELAQDCGTMADLERLYPGDVMIALGCQKDKKYKFIVLAEEI
jgi:hypothetical protein